MNQRIRELAVKSGQIVGELPLNASEKIQLAGLEKFAELIVKQCSQWIVDNAESINTLGPEYFAKAMVQHFEQPFKVNP